MNLFLLSVLPLSVMLPRAAAWRAMTGALTGNYDAPSIV
jgi:hypothetical protein